MFDLLDSLIDSKDNVKHFKINDHVYFKNILNNKWEKGTIVEIPGKLEYKILTEEGNKIVRRHANHVTARIANSNVNDQRRTTKRNKLDDLLNENIKQSCQPLPSTSTRFPTSAPSIPTNNGETSAVCTASRTSKKRINNAEPVAVTDLVARPKRKTQPPNKLNL